ncbi:SNF1-related protein kinase regulatory subunit gamma-1-like isoform X1 [Phragmites australis]|uniref:SNF1-related protein kinase regulatory subunit gamma-1-like isoform X1 n=1 Tax=Phragmites australis TaxID=29695 RepID=UPI002D789236|nr:SNF1-related protein kinase regulatory subunit gamma-1-like isoform X1 [Phragmites australis]
MEMESPRSPEAEIGHRVEDLWEVVEPQLSPSEKLNSCFEDIPVASFPRTHPSQVIEIPSDATLAQTVKILSKNKILSAPIRNVEAPEEASWMDKYIGIVEFAGIAMWLLSQQSDAAANGTAGSAAGSPVANLVARLGSFTFRRTSSGRVETTTDSKSDEAVSVGGSFFETLTSSEFYKNTKVGDISGSFRWAPFLALQTSDTFLTMLLLLSKYRMKSLPVVEVGGDKIENIITQSSVVHMLAECVGLPWFESWGTKKLSELGLPIMKPYKLIKVNEDQPVLKAFQLMREKGVGGLPVMDTSGAKAIGNISIRDVQYLLTAPKIYKEHRTITAKDFLTEVRHHLQEQHEASPLLHDVITCKKDDTIKDIILRLDSEKIHRIYVVDDKGNTEGVITLRDIISKLVHEPRHYFGDFFDGVVPLPPNSTV